MQQEEKQKALATIANENELRVELVVPLLKKMNAYTEVLDNQGPDEAGVDVIGVSTSPFKMPVYTAFILKHGNINLVAADKTNNLITIIETQIRQAIRQPLSHPRLTSNRAFANHVIVITNGTISRSAEAALQKSFRETREISIDFVAQDRLIDQIDKHWPRFYEDRRPFLSTYAKKIYDSLNVVDLELLGYAKSQKQLSEIYIDTLLYPQTSIAKPEFYFEDKPVAGEELCKQTNRLIVVTSGPGGGKTTLLKELAILQSKSDKECVAVYLHARDVLQSKNLLLTAATSLSELSNDGPEDVYEEIRRSNILYLVDGLDELGSLADRETVIQELRSAASGKRGTRVVLASRPESNPRILASLNDFASYSISPLRLGQIRTFFGKWFGGNSEKASKLLDALRDKGVFEKLPRTPMTMTLVAIVFESKEDLPSTLTDLYLMFVELLTGKWDSNRKVASAFDPQMKVAFLERLAWTMHAERLEVLSYERTIDVASDFLKQEATLSDVDPIQFIQSIIDRSQILVPTDGNLIRFSHMTFQEFFCAQSFAANQPSDQMILSWYGDDWWKEVLFFIAGRQKNISGIVNLLLNSDHSDPDTRLTRLTTLGSMLQAGIFTNRDCKTRGVSFAAERFLLCLDDVMDLIRKEMPLKVRQKMTRTIMLGILHELYSSNFTSTYLLESLTEAFQSYPDDKKFEGARFFLGCSLARLGVYDPLLEFSTDPRMVDPGMYLASRIELDGTTMTPVEQRAFKKVKARIRDFESALKRDVKAFLPNAGSGRTKRRRPKKRSV